MTLHFIVHGRLPDRDGWRDSSFQETVIPSLNGKAGSRSFRFTVCRSAGCDRPTLACGAWSGKDFLVHFRMEKVTDTEHVNNVTFSLSVKEGRRWCLVRGEGSPFVGGFWHWILFIPSGHIFLERKGQKHFLHFLYPPAQLLNFFPWIALLVSKRACSIQWWTFVGYPSPSQPTVLAHHHSLRGAWFLLGDAGEETKI